MPINSRLVATALVGVALASAFLVWTRQSGLKFYRLHQEDGERPVFVGEQGPGRITHIEWDQDTVSTSLIESEWYVIPTHAFRCWAKETDTPQRDFQCKGQVVRGVEASASEGETWDVTAPLRTPQQVKNVKLQFSEARPIQADHTVTVKQQMAADVVWTEDDPVVWNAVLTRRDKTLKWGVGKPCYKPHFCYERAQLEVTVTTTSLISIATDNWPSLLAANGDWRLAITQNTDQPFNPGPQPVLGNSVPYGGGREEISGSVRGFTLYWPTYQATSGAMADGTTAAAIIKYEAPDDITLLCLTALEFSHKKAAITGASLEGCR